MIRKVSSKTVYQNRWMTVREDVTQLPDGAPGLYGVIDKPDFAAIVPMHTDGQIQLVEQYRYPVARRMWEIPQGGWPSKRTAPALDLANAELQEETGFRAAHLDHIGKFHANPAMCSQAYDLFLATGLAAGKTAREATEQDMQTRRFTFDEILAMIDRAEITCAASIAALGLLRLKGKI